MFRCPGLVDGKRLVKMPYWLFASGRSSPSCNQKRQFITSRAGLDKPETFDSAPARHEQPEEGGLRPRITATPASVHRRAPGTFERYPNTGLGSHSRLAGSPHPTTCLFSFSSAPTSSSSTCKCFRTSWCGVSAIHWFNDTSAKRSLLNISRKRSGSSPMFWT
jgi:hypothetical protein